MNDEHLTPPDEPEDRNEQSDRPPPGRPGRDDLNLCRGTINEALQSKKLRNSIAVILRHAQGRNPRWDELMDETEEILGEVAVIALESLEHFDPNRGRALSWLMGIAVNVIRAHRRRQKGDHFFLRRKVHSVRRPGVRFWKRSA